MAATIREIHTPVTHALELAAMGLKIVPVWGIRDGVCECGRGKNCDAPGKHPIGKGWYERATDDLDEIRKIIYGTRNYGVAMGSASGIFAVDFDGKEGMSTLQEWLEEGLPATWEIQTGSGCRQLWFRVPEGVRVPNSVKMLGKGVDIRGECGQSVGPGSLHMSGKRYKMLRGFHDGFELADAPPWLLSALAQLSTKQKEIDVVAINDIELSEDLLMRIGMLQKKSKKFHQIIEGEATYDSSSQRDMAIANLMAVNEFNGDEIACVLKMIRKNVGEKLKHKLYYELTASKALSWRDEELKSSGVTVIETDEEIEDIVIAPPPPVVIEEFPVTVFPKVIREFMKSVAISVSAPIDYVGNPLLAVAGLAIGKKYALEIKEGYRQYPNLYCAVVGSPGTAKTPAQSIVFSPLDEIQQEHYEAFKEEKKKYDKNKLAYKKEMHIWKHDKNNNVPMPDGPERPLLREVYSTQSTTEALSKMLGKGEVILKLDELSGLLSGLNQYKGGKGDDLEFYLSAWGNVTIKINRAKDDEPTIIPNPFCSITGNLPPDLLARLRPRGESEDGFVDRFLVSYPNDQEIKTFSWEGVPQSLMDAYSSMIRTLYSMQEGIMRMDDDARKLWSSWHDEHKKEMNSPEFPSILRGPYAKMPNQIARLSIIMHLILCACKENDETSVLNHMSFMCAWELVNYFKTHLKKVYVKMETTQAEDRAIRAIEKIKERGGEISLRDAVRINLAGCKKRSEVEELFDTLVDFGYGKVTVVKPKNGGRQTKRFNVNHT